MVSDKILHKTELLEREILSCLLCNSNLFKDYDIDFNIFYNPLYKRIFLILKGIYEKKRKYDMTDIAVELLCGDTEDIVSQLIQDYVSCANFQYRVGELEEIHKMIQLNLIIKNINDEKISLDEAIESIIKMNNSTKEENNINKLSTDDIFDLITNKEERLTFNEFEWLNDKIGFIKKTVNVISARPSVGKTAFGLNLFNDLMREYKVIFFNMEMNETEIYTNLASINSEIPKDQIKLEAKTNHFIETKVKNGIHEQNQGNYKIYTGSKTINSIKKIISKESKNEHCIVFVDYVGLVKIAGKNQNDRERIGEVMREFKIITNDYDCTLFVMAQINRTGDSAPDMTHVKDSGEIEQTAHVLMILHDSKNDKNEQAPIYDLIIAKNRSGRKGLIKIQFNKPIQKFRKVVYK